MLLKSMLGVLVLVIASMGSVCFAEEFTSTDDYGFTLTNSTTEITHYKGDATELNIPSSIEHEGKTYIITSIGDAAFNGCSSLISVTIPDSVTSIGDGAFGGCNGLVSITIPDGVTSIGGGAFGGCSSLVSITIPDGITSIETSTFIVCKKLTSITIPDSVTSIGGEAFYGCTSLTVTIPDSVTYIHKWAFYDIIGLRVSPGSYAHAHAMKGYESYSLCPVIEKAYRTTDNLRLRQNEGTAGTPLFTLPKGTSVKVLAQGNVQTIDGIRANWVQVEVADDTVSVQGTKIEKGSVGWCFGGYLGAI